MARIPASIRNKNPGAMWPGAIATKWGSKHYETLNDGQGNKIATFDNWVDGICAQLDLWRTSKNYKNKRFADAIAIWSGHNNVSSYVAYVKARVPGITESTIMDDTFWNGPMGLAFLKAQSGHEAGQAIPAPTEDWVEAQRRVFAATPPAGAHVPTKQELFVQEIKDFQKANSLGVDGVIGPATWAVIKAKMK